MEVKSDKSRLEWVPIDSRCTVTVLVAGRGADNFFMSRSRSMYVLTTRERCLFTCDVGRSEPAAVSHNTRY